MPVGGESAINPQPPEIAYYEGAEGTTVFQVRVDERGAPTKCMITKTSGYRILDDAVCKAALSARYTPKMVDGRAVSGLYSDAFTFHLSEDNPNVEGVPQTINELPHTMRSPHPNGPPPITIPGTPGDGN
jgi:TonB family protein